MQIKGNPNLMVKANSLMRNGESPASRSKENSTNRTHENSTARKVELVVDDDRLSLGSILKSSDDSCEGLNDDNIVPKASSRSQSRAGGSSNRTPRPIHL